MAEQDQQSSDKGPYRKRPKDPVLDFIYDPSVYALIVKDEGSWPWSRLSASRLHKIGYLLVTLRCAQIGVTPPSPGEASEWRLPAGNAGYSNPGSPDDKGH